LSNSSDFSKTNIILYILIQIIILFLMEMQKSVFRKWVKMIKIERLHWKMVKSYEFDFLKVKILFGKKN